MCWLPPSFIVPSPVANEYAFIILAIQLHRKRKREENDDWGIHTGYADSVEHGLAVMAPTILLMVRDILTGSDIIAALTLPPLALRRR